ncbi:MAG TPA: hypothetical protein VHA52_06145, partial [Candidatus Babeliaceae bacterium]|nr:hypothetical protein [Candidatus Babeliaceae bacterium]
MSGEEKGSGGQLSRGGSAGGMQRLVIGQDSLEEDFVNSDDKAATNSSNKNQQTEKILENIMLSLNSMSAFMSQQTAFIAQLV